jgi:tetratricopeptide (TPR) repeat protein
MNNNSSFNPMVLLGIGICLAAIPLLFLYLFSRVDTKLQNAEKLYSQGENGNTISARTESFNQALNLYLQLEQEYAPINGNGKLYYDIANTYFQLGQYPLAAFYYNQSHILMPRDDRVTQNLSRTLDQLHLPQSQETSPFSRFFYFHSKLSLPERFQLFSAAVILTTLLASAYIWLGWKQLKLFAEGTLLISVVFFLSICYTKYLAPTEAVIVQASNIYRDAGNQYSTVQKEPVPPGTKVKVLTTEKNGTWVKVVIPDGTLGYLLQQNIRILQN